jgi:hypothetical protein
MIVTMIVQWVVQAMRFMIAPLLCPAVNVTFVTSSVELWDTFVESEEVTTLLSFRDNNNNEFVPLVSDWQKQLCTAFRLCRELNLEGRLDVDQVYPVLSRLILETYFAEQSFHMNGDEDNVPQDPLLDRYTLVSLIGCTLFQSCPTCVLTWIVETYPEQLRVTDPITGQLPLAAACSSPHCTSNQLVTILNAYPQAVGIPDSTGEYPLHLACQSGCFSWESGLAQLFQAAPHVLSIRATGNGGYSLFLLTALAQTSRMDESNDVESTYTLYQLLRNDSTVVRDFLAVQE